MGWFERGQVVGRLEQTDREQQAEITELRQAFAAYQQQNAPALAWAEEQRTRRSHVRGLLTGIVTGIRSRLAIAIYALAASYLLSQALQHLRLPHLHF